MILRFYDKFNIRHNIAELVKYMWSVPSHHNAWKKVFTLTLTKQSARIQLFVPLSDAITILFCIPPNQQITCQCSTCKFCILFVLCQSTMLHPTSCHHFLRA